MQQTMLKLDYPKDYGYEVTVKQNGIGIENELIQNGGNIINVEQVN